MPDIAGPAPAPANGNPSTSQPSAQVSRPFLALVLVLDSSTLVGQAFPHFFDAYFFPFAKRLAESNPSFRPRIAFVTYGPSDYERPIMARNFFVDINSTILKLKDNPDMIRIGATNYNPQVGMATLDGLVAALELLDDLETSEYQRVQGQGCILHVLHVSACQPSEATNPICNDKSIFDSVTWTTLPDEFKKRNIGLSTISLGREIPKITALQTSCNGGRKIVPWFNVSSTDQVLLSSGIAVSITPPKGVKRASDVEPQSPDSKRVRTAGPEPASSPNKSSSLPVPPSPKKVDAPRPESLEAPPSTSIQSAANPLSPAFPPLPVQKQRIVDSGRKISVRLAQLEGQIKLAEESRNLELRKTLDEEKLQLQRSLALLRLQFGKLASLNPPQTGVPPTDPSGNPPQGEGAQSVEASASKPVVSPAKGLPNHVSPSPAIPQISQPPNTLPNQPHTGQPPQPTMQSPTFSSYPPNESALQSQPNMLAQMAKLLEQKRRSTGAGADNQVIGGLPAIPPTTLTQSQAMPVPFGVPQSRPEIVWNGQVAMVVPDKQGKPQELICHVSGATASQNSKAETWPSRLTVAPSQMLKSDDVALRGLIATRNPVFVLFNPSINPPNGQPSNSASYVILAKSIQMRQTYPIAAWVGMDGQKHNALFFLRQDKICAAFFASPSTTTSSQPPLPNGMTAEQVFQRAASLPTPQKIQFLQAFKNKMEMQNLQSSRDVSLMNSSPVPQGLPMNMGLMGSSSMSAGNMMQPQENMARPFGAAGNPSFSFNGMNTLHGNPQLGKLGMLNAMGVNQSMLRGMAPQGQNVIQRNPNLGL